MILGLNRRVHSSLLYLARNKNYNFCFVFSEILEESLNQNILWDQGFSESNIFDGNQICKRICIGINKGRTSRERWLLFLSG